MIFEQIIYFNICYLMANEGIKKVAAVQRCRHISFHDLTATVLLPSRLSIQPECPFHPVTGNNDCQAVFTICTSHSSYCLFVAQK